MINQGSTASLKNELVTTAAEARVFFERELEKRCIAFSIPAWKIESDKRFQEQEIEIWIKPANRLSDKEPDVIFHAKAYVFRHDGSLTIEMFGISPHPFGISYANDPYKGKQLGLVGLKALIGIAHEYLGSVDRICLKEVEQDGPRFWSYLGAFPMGISQSISVGDLRQRLLKSLEHYSNEPCTTLREITALAEEYPALAYRALSQIRPSGLKRRTVTDIVCENVIERMCKGGDKDMIIDLKDLSTLGLLRQRLGALPLCPVPVSFSDAAYETARRNNDSTYSKREDRYIKMEMARFRLTCG